MFRSLVASLFLFASSAYAEIYESFRLENAPISEFVAWFSDVSGKTVVLSPQANEVRLSVHVKNLDSADLVPFVDSVMAANGLAVNESAGVLSIVPRSSADSRQVEIPPSSPPERPEEPPVVLESRIYTLERLRNKNVSEVVEAVIGSSDQTDQTANVVLMPASNALLVSATAEQLATLDTFIDQIDTDERQILVEAIIVESDLGDAERSGVSLATSLAASGFSLVTGVVPNAVELSGLGAGASLVYQRGGDVRGLAQALSTNDRTKILSTPKILVMDRERGYISVGQNVPFLTSKQTTDGGTVIQNVERRDVGVSLTVRPHVVGDFVTLEIQQESSSVSTSTIAADVITNRRTIQTVAKVKDGESLLLGGLVTDEKRDTSTRVPILGAIPWIGAFFRQQSHEVVQRELNVLIKVLVL